MRKLICIAVLAAIACSCTVTKPLYNWKGYDEAVYSYIKSPSDQSVADLEKVYERLMTNTGSREVPPPGLCADYGYLLIKSGQIEKGKELLVKETKLYPESKPFIDRILKRFDQ
jgi:hypothetical protein